MISDTFHLFRQLKLAFCLNKEWEEREQWGRRKRRGETEGETGEWGGGLANKRGCEGGLKTLLGRRRV